MRAACGVSRSISHAPALRGSPATPNPPHPAPHTPAPAGPAPRHVRRARHPWPPSKQNSRCRLQLPRIPRRARRAATMGAHPPPQPRQTRRTHLHRRPAVVRQPQGVTHPLHPEPRRHRGRGQQPLRIVRRCWPGRHLPAVIGIGGQTEGVGIRLRGGSSVVRTDRPSGLSTAATSGVPYRVAGGIRPTGSKVAVPRGVGGDINSVDHAATVTGNDEANFP
jgi:hypothetical protein